MTGGVLEPALKRFGIATRTAIALVVCAATLFGIAGWAHLRGRNEAERALLEERARGLTGVVIRTIRNSMINFRPHELRPVLQAIATTEGVSGIAVEFPAGKPIFASGVVPPRLPAASGTPEWGGDVLGITRPLEATAECAACHEGAEHGAVYVGLALAPAQLREREARNELIAILFAALLLTAGVIVLVVRHWVTAPLLRWQTFAQRVADGELSARPPEERWPETSALSGALAKMAEQIQASHTELERRVDERTRQLLDAERLATLGQMSAQVAHELRNPLNAINGAVQYLRRVLRAEPQMAEYGQLIQDEIQRVNRFIDDLLRVARPAAAALEPADLTEIAQEAARRATLARGLEPAAVQASLAPDLPWLPVDRRMMMEAVVNLLDNALDAGGPQPPELVTRVEPEPSGGQAIVLEVLDRGAGLPPRLVNEVTRPFVTTKSHGTGLGLVIVTRAVEQHRGAFRIGNREGGGAAATIRLPVPEEARA